MRRVLLLSGLGVFLVGAFLLGYAVVGSNRQHAAPQTTVVDAVRAELAARYYRPVPSSVLRQQTVDSMIAALHDPYTEYLDRSAYELLQRQLAGRYSGIGVTLLPVKDGLLVAGTQPGPARDAGVRTGDTIVRVDKTPAVRLGPANALARIGGRAGTSVALQVRRGTRLLRFTIRRAEVISPDVVSRTISFRHRLYGYVAVLWFGEGVAARVAADLRELPQHHLAGLVLDVRNNPGGLLDQAVKTSSLFLHGGPVVTLTGAHQPRRVYRASSRVLAPGLPLAVLINGGSASSAEVVAAALHDNARAILVGRRTFGKAVVQSLEPLANGGALALTTARYLTPTGADISSRGIVPSVRVSDDPQTPVDEVLNAALRALANGHS